MQGRHSNFKIHCDAKNQVGLDSTEVGRQVVKKDATTQWDSNLVDAATQFTELYSRNAYKPVDRKDATTQWEDNLEDNTDNVSNTKKDTAVVAEKSSMNIITLMRENDENDLTTPVTSTSDKIGGELFPPQDHQKDHDKRYPQRKRTRLNSS